MLKLSILFIATVLLILINNVSPTEDSTERTVEDRLSPNENDGGVKDTNLDDHLDALLHGGEKHVHDREPKDESKSEKSNYPDMAEKLDSLLHNGEEHVHSGKHRSFAASVEPSNVQFGTLNQEAILHNGDSHIHSKETTNNLISNKHVVGAPDLEHVLHGEHVHGKIENKKNESSGEAHDVDIELEALLHGGDGHVHEKKQETTTTSGIMYKASDPEHMLHESDSDPHQHELEKEAADGSRPLRGPDPTIVPNEPQEIHATIGTMNEEDYLDYKKWKREKTEPSSWLNGFSYLSDKISFDLNSVKQRLFGFINSTEDTIPHDEA